VCVPAAVTNLKKRIESPHIDPDKPRNVIPGNLKKRIERDDILLEPPPNPLIKNLKKEN